MKIKFTVCKIGGLYKWSVFLVNKGAPAGAMVSYLDYGCAASDFEARQMACRAIMEYV